MGKDKEPCIVDVDEGVVRSPVHRNLRLLRLAGTYGYWAGD
jgi:hypothetical protein